ncbi:hypothetical protein LguiB_003179 [Lonicera macranthoides]
MESGGPVLVQGGVKGGLLDNDRNDFGYFDIDAGVISVALEGEEKDKVVVIGDLVDAAALANSIRKKVGFASLELVDELK